MVAAASNTAETKSKKIKRVKAASERYRKEAKEATGIKHRKEVVKEGRGRERGRNNRVGNTGAEIAAETDF